MTFLSREILEKWQVRKTRAQKLAFLEYMKQQLPGAYVEEGGFIKSRNLVIGDVAKADVVLTAHYDTCARLPFPNFLTPKNWFLFICYQLLIVVPFLLILFGSSFLLGKLGLDAGPSIRIADFLFFGSMIYVMMLGPANKHTANDNTSGVITLCEIYLNMPPEQREKAAFVFFDNEENGLLGSSEFYARHKKEGMDGKLLINFDCVSDGDYLMLVLSKKANKLYKELFARHYRPHGEKTVLLETAGSAIYPSDQSKFPYGVGVAAFKRKRFVGYYMNRIHTSRDTQFDPANISLLTASTISLISEL